MEIKSKNILRQTINLGFIAGLISLSVSIIGMVQLLAQRGLIAGILTMGQLILYMPAAIFAYYVSGKISNKNSLNMLFSGLLTGFISAIPLVVLLLLASVFNLRRFFVNISPFLIDLLSFGQNAIVGSLLIMAAMSLVGLVAASVHLIPSRIRKPLITGLLYTLVIGLFSEILTERVRALFGPQFVRLIFTAKALKPLVALILFLIFAGISVYWEVNQDRIKNRFISAQAIQAKRLQVGRLILGFVFLMILPLLLGTYLSEVINNVGLFILMGFGLNIVVGFAGLLDLGYVAFFAIGAYTMGLLTSEGFLGIAQMSFWLAIPICVLVAVFAGVMLGIPVLRMRGDYLAIVTLGFGEIIRIMANSDLLKPYAGGAQGVLQIPKPEIFGLALIKPEQLYYVILAGCLLAAFVSWRLSNARIGRQWMATREDEDVAEAMGINLVATKLLAFGIGAAFSGLAGAIFAPKLTSIFPHSFNLLISINVLCLIIVGGMGSLPGVVVGSLILVGLPELLREFAEFRYLMYGALLIVMMLSKPEGFWPSAVLKRELHIDEEPVSVGDEPDILESSVVKG
jgi:branched-chain amino acid transport system permease protein